MACLKGEVLRICTFNREAILMSTCDRNGEILKLWTISRYGSYIFTGGNDTESRDVSGFDSLHGVQNGDGFLDEDDRRELVFDTVFNDFW